MKFKNQEVYPDVEMTLLRKLDADDPARIGDQDTYVLRRADGTEVYASKEDLDEKELAEAEKTLREAETPDEPASGAATPDKPASEGNDGSTRPARR
jgi:hypothetical protein